MTHYGDGTHVHRIDDDFHCSIWSGDPICHPCFAIVPNKFIEVGGTGESNTFMRYPCSGREPTSFTKVLRTWDLHWIISDILGQFFPSRRRRFPIQSPVRRVVVFGDKDDEEQVKLIIRDARLFVWSSVVQFRWQKSLELSANCDGHSYEAKLLLRNRPSNGINGRFCGKIPVRERGTPARRQRFLLTHSIEGQAPSRPVGTCPEFRLRIQPW
ncbi:hypothetical protein RUA8715_01499 [Ruegeria arenilitoris]|uniref:Uncharacterized protein n=1 Tax=Ruegeria arenilitoris TaxID=1173585 RepID=A0A238KAR8_9RHOB|nr:hypothetical protein RUA8715_01499 [Ruegeria arenilitoris]